MERVYDRVPFYKRQLAEHSLKPADIKGVDDLHKLPFTRKQDLRDTYPFGMFAVPQREVVRLHASSGTSGKPTIVGYTRADIEVFSEVVARSMAAAGARPGMMFHNAYGYGLFTGGLGLHYGGETLGVTVVPVSGGMTERQLTLIRDLKPQVIACTPSYAQTLAEAFAQGGTAPDETSLRYAILGAEPWTEAIRKDVEAGLGVKATNIYGLSEIIGPGVSNEDVNEQNGAYVWEDHFYPEIVHPETGEPLPDGEAGVLVLTTLTKETLPLVRYWTGDVTTLTREVGPSGRTHARMGMIRGRSDDMLIIRGINLYPTQIEEILVRFPEVALHYQLALSRPQTLDKLELRLELTQAAFSRFGGSLEGQEHVSEVQGICRNVQRRVKDTVGITARVTLLAPGTAPRSAGGKLRRIVDERAL